MVDNGIMTLIIILVVVSLIAFFCLGYLYARIKINRIIDREVMKRIERDFINNLNIINKNNKNNNIKNVKVRKIDVDNLNEFENLLNDLLEHLDNEEENNKKEK